MNFRPWRRKGEINKSRDWHLNSTARFGIFFSKVARTCRMGSKRPWRTIVKRSLFNALMWKSALLLSYSAHILAAISQIPSRMFPWTLSSMSSLSGKFHRNMRCVCVCMCACVRMCACVNKSILEEQSG